MNQLDIRSKVLVAGIFLACITKHISVPSINLLPYNSKSLSASSLCGVTERIPFTRNCAFDVLEFIVANGTLLSEISEKENSLTRYSQIFEIFLLKIIISLDFFFVGSQNSVNWFGIRKLNGFRNFQELFIYSCCRTLG